MVVPNEVAVTTVAPLREQRRGQRERARALTALSDRQSGGEAEPSPPGVLPDAVPGAARLSRQRVGAVVGRLLGRPRFPKRHLPPLSTARRMVVSSAATEAALAQRITGLGSGPYSGKPFRPVPGAADAAGRMMAAGEPCEAARHDHGIIDHSRHVSSLGRR